MSFNIYPPSIPNIMMNPYYYPASQHDYNAHMPAWKLNVTIGGITSGVSIILLIPVVLICFQMYTVISHGGGFNGGRGVIGYDAVRRSNGVQLAVLFHYAYYLHACSQLVS